jgi:transcriptional regulator of acetoin/glycerol metabolism
VSALSAAKPGTLFLRGIDDLTDQAQDALLALLDARDDLRVISSERIAGEEHGVQLRSDLYYRLSGAVLTLPPLRLRSDFDWLLERLFRRRASDDMRLTPAARIELAGRHWPGNIRELAHALDTAIAMADGTVIDVPDLPEPVIACAQGDDPEEDLAALLTACNWNMSQAARRLGVNRSTVLRRARKAGLNPPAAAT